MVVLCHKLCNRTFIGIVIVVVTDSGMPSLLPCVVVEAGVIDVLTPTLANGDVIEGVA